ncbi:MAG TPA: outer membrane lipoprotein carrier protein LolA [Pseudonocardiaceae bacterium]|jgi:outer membrane lipoprotein-sorting protein|nr:outer membrane lipoprotein carrier protein LolA [Pseudonocardiaceae bacterium]
MNRRRITLGAAAAGVVAGAVGIGFLAAPAGAGQSPTLPGTTPAALVQSVLTSSPPAMSGTVAITNNLGLPAVPGLPAALAGGNNNQIRVWTDGVHGSRISLPTPTSEETIIDDGTTVYDWNSATRTVTEHHLNKADGKTAHKAEPAKPDTSNANLDPASVARQLVSSVRQTSTISVDGTDVVANRPAYDLVLTPKPSQRTLLRQVRIAVDAQTHMPLQLTVLANNTNTPALQIGFNSIDIGPQDPALFRFSVPAGATVTNGDNKDKQSVDTANQTAPSIVGSGWETVVVMHLPSSMGQSGKGPDPMRLVQEFGKPISGSWGTGSLISTDVGNALVTSDGRVAAGFVPTQLLIKALG